jgi:hypothetical protein
LAWTNLSRREDRRPHVANAIFLTTLALVFFKIGTNRADLGHLLSALWPSLLMVAWWNGIAREGDGNPWPRRILLALMIVYAPFALVTLKSNSLAAAITFSASVAAGIVLLGKSGDGRFARFGRLSPLVLAVPLALATGSAVKGAWSGDYAWLSYLAAPPTNEAVVTEGVRWVGQRMRDHSAVCVFDLSNNGVINGLTGLPTCTRFSYPVYADARFQDEIIADLQRSKPSPIVYSSTSWSYAIDGKPMNRRLPELDLFIRSHYGEEECAFGYCLRYLPKGS